MSEIKTSKKSDIVKVILAIVAVLLGVYMFVDPAKSDYNVDPAVTSKIDSLQGINDSLVIKNAELDSLMEEYRMTIDDLDCKLSDLNKRRSEASDYFGNKHNELDENPTSLDTFFMNRYGYFTEE